MAESCESSQTQGLLKDNLNNVSGSNSSNPSDMNFEVINCKLDKLMQIVALTEKKPSVQMQHLLELNDNEDEMKLYSKQVNLELQNIIKEQNFQLAKYHKEHLRKQEKREEEIFAMKELYYGQIKKQNDTIKYLSDQNGLLRKEDKELKLENEQLIESIKLCTSQKQSEEPAHMEEESLEGKQELQSEVIKGSTNEEFKLRQQVQALEKMVRLILKNRNSAQTQREEIFDLKNQLDQKIIENAEQLNENISIKKKYDELIRNNKKNGIKSNNIITTNKANVGKNQQEKRQTRGKKVNYKDIIKTYDEEIEEEESSQESNESASEENSSEDENGSKQNIAASNKENKNPNNNGKKRVNNRKTKGDDGDGADSDEQDSSFGSDEELDEEKENSDDESSYSDSSNKKKKQAKKGSNSNNNNAAKQQQPKNGRALPAKKRAVQSDQHQQQRKKKVPKKVLKKNQDAQDRMFDQVDRMMQDL